MENIPVFGLILLVGGAVVLVLFVMVIAARFDRDKARAAARRSDDGSTAVLGATAVSFGAGHGGASCGGADGGGGSCS